MRDCPDCRCQMAQKSFGDVTLDVCGECAGVWFDEGELLRARQSQALALIHMEDEYQPATAVHTASSQPRRCPDCGRVLDAFRYVYDSPIHLDRCEGCGGVWIDDGELRKMQEWLDRTALRERESLPSLAADPQRRWVLAPAFVSWVLDGARTLSSLL